MGLFFGAGSSKSKGNAPAIPFPSEFLPPPHAPAHRLRQCISVPVHQVEWHWQHRVPLPYPDATLPHDWHLDPKRIPVPPAPQSARAHGRCGGGAALLTAEQRRDPTYASDSSNWARWFAFEHEEARRCGIREVDRSVPPPPLIVHEEDQEAVFRESKEDERRRLAANEEEEAAYETFMAHAMALSSEGDCVVPPVARYPL